MVHLRRTQFSAICITKIHISEMAHNTPTYETAKQMNRTQTLTVFDYSSYEVNLLTIFPKKRIQISFHMNRIQCGSQKHSNSITGGKINAGEITNLDFHINYSEHILLLSN